MDVSPPEVDRNSCVHLVRHGNSTVKWTELFLSTSIQRSLLSDRRKWTHLVRQITRNDRSMSCVRFTKTNQGWTHFLPIMEDVSAIAFCLWQTIVFPLRSLVARSYRVLQATCGLGLVSIKGVPKQLWWNCAADSLLGGVARRRGCREANKLTHSKWEGSILSSL